MVAPIIPGLNDHEIERILDAARDAGARDAGYVLLRLPLEIKELFREWLATEFPDRAARVINILRSMHGGRDYVGPIRRATARQRALRRADRGPLPPRIAAARHEPAAARSAHRPVFSTGAEGRTDAPALTALPPARTIAHGKGRFATAGIFRAGGGIAAPPRRADLRHRRGRSRSLGRSGGGRGGDPRPGQHPSRHRRQQAARRRCARDAVPAHRRYVDRRCRHRRGRADRSRQHPQRHHVGDAAGGIAAAEPAEAGPDRRQPGAAAEMRYAHDREGRRALPVDRGGIDRRQGHPRPHHDRARRASCRNTVSSGTRATAHQSTPRHWPGLASPPIIGARSSRCSWPWVSSEGPGGGRPSSHPRPKPCRT